MRIDELQKKLLKSVRGTLTHKDLISLCTYSEISSSGLKRSIQDRLELYISKQSYSQLLTISNKIDEYHVLSKKTNIPVMNTPESTPSTYIPDTLSDSLLQLAPISLDEEVAKINRKAVVVLHFTTYANALTAVPSHTVTGINERAHNLRLPNMLPHVTVEISPFYCGVVCLHPLSLLVPQKMPNVAQPTRVYSQSSFQFILSDDAQKLISKNTTTVNGKVDYKWQVLLRFVSVDPTTSVPIPGQSVSQIMPPYVSVSVNNDNVPLWDVLPSNCRAKEGKRHPKAINITEKLGGKRMQTGNQQIINISWWQTPGVFQYYYLGVYLERKLAVSEILDVLASDRHVNVLPVETTLTLIKSKLQVGKYRNNDEDDDLVVSSVLPISLSCPVGRSRIEIPIRTIKCLHLQCFDAHLFLSMNERRSSWKCPVCEASATPKELFCDQYFKIILNVYKNNEDINDLNVSSDGSYVPVFSQKNDKACTENHADDLQRDMVVLDSDDDDELYDQKKSSAENPLKLSDKERYYAAKDTSKCPTKATPSKSYEIFNQTTPQRSKSMRPPTSTANSDKHVDGDGVGRQTKQKAAPKNIHKTSLPSVISAPLVSSNSMPLFSAPLSSSIDPLLFNPLSLASRTSMPVIQAPTSFQGKMTQEQSNAVPSSISTKQTIVAPILAPISISTLPSIVTSISDPIPAPIKMGGTDTIASRKSMWDALAAPTSILTEVVPTPTQLPDTNPAKSPHSRSPISAPIFESQIKLKSTTKVAPGRLNGSTIPSFPNTALRYTGSTGVDQSFDVVRTIKDVVKTLPTDSTCPIDSTIANKKVVAQPINCPVTVIDQLSPATSDDEVTEMNRTEVISKAGPPETVVPSSRLVKKCVPSNVYITPVSIDLTEDDEEEVPVTTPLINAHPLNGRGIKYCDVNDIAFRRTLYNSSGLPNKFSTIDQRRTVLQHSYPNMKTHQYNLMKRPANHNPVDLTGDDDDESPTKKQKNGGCAPQVLDSGSESPSESSSSSSDTERRNSRMDLGGRQPPSTYRG